MLSLPAQTITPARCRPPPIKRAVAAPRYAFYGERKVVKSEQKKRVQKVKRVEKVRAGEAGREKWCSSEKKK
jgi:hypothetical protein